MAVMMRLLLSAALLVFASEARPFAMKASDFDEEFGVQYVDAGGKGKTAGFLGSRGQHVPVAGLQKGLEELDLLQKVGDMLGQQRSVVTELRIARIHEEVRPMFEAMPKDVNGGLSSGAVRGLLFRLFVQRRTASVRDMTFEETADGQSFDLHQAAVLGAAIESESWTQHMELVSSQDEMQNIIEDSGSAQEEVVGSAGEATSTGMSAYPVIAFACSASFLALRLVAPKFKKQID